MEVFRLFTYIMISAAAGMLVGLEREHTTTRRKKECRVIVGIRTFPMASLAGTLIAFLARGDVLGLNPNPSLVPVALVIHGFFCLAIFFVTFLRRGRAGFSTVSAFYIMFVVGLLVGYELWFIAITITLFLALLLLLKSMLHNIVRFLTREEIFSALQFLCIAFILYPIATMGNLFERYEFIGPGKLFDVQWIILIMVFVAAISFVSFIILRKMGSHKGLLLSGFLGGLVNSEATAASLGHLAKEKSFFMYSAFAGILLTNVSMLLRNMIIVGFADQSFRVLSVFAIPCVIMILASLGVFIYVRKRHKTENKNTVYDLRLSSPFAIKPAIRFALLFSIVSAFSYLLTQLFGEAGVYFTAIGGLVSSAAVSASVATMGAAGSITPMTAGITASLACVISVVNKIYVVRTVNPHLTKHSWKWFLLKGSLGLGTIGLMLLLL